MQMYNVRYKQFKVLEGSMRRRYAIFLVLDHEQCLENAPEELYDNCNDFCKQNTLSILNYNALYKKMYNLLLLSGVFAGFATP